MSSPIDKFLKELSSEAAAKAKPPARKQQMDAVMSDSGLFDVHSLVTPGKKPAGPAVDTSKSNPPAATSDSKPPVDIGKSKSGGPSAAEKKLMGRGDSVMSDSGLFDVREMVADLKGKKPIAGGNSMNTPTPVSGGAKPAAPAAKKPNVQDFELFDFRDGAGGEKKAPSGGKVPLPSEGSSKVTPAFVPVKPPAMPTIDDNPIMSDSGLFDVRELVAEVNKKPAAKPRIPAKAEAPTELGVAPVRGPEPVRPPTKKIDPPSRPGTAKPAVRPVGKPMEAIEFPSKTGAKPVGKPVATASGKIPSAPSMPGNVPTKSGKAPVSPPSRGGVAKPVSKAGPSSKKPVAMDDIIAHRDDPNNTAEERMARKEATKQGKVYVPPKSEEPAEGGSSTATLMLLLLIVLAGGGAALYYFYGLQN